MRPHDSRIRSDRPPLTSIGCHWHVLLRPTSRDCARHSSRRHSAMCRGNTRQPNTATTERDLTRRASRPLRLRRMRCDHRRVPTYRSPHADIGRHRHGLARHTSRDCIHHSSRRHSTTRRGSTRQPDTATTEGGPARRASRPLRLLRMRRSDRRILITRSPHAAIRSHGHVVTRRTLRARAHRGSRRRPVLRRGSTRRSNTAATRHGSARRTSRARAHYGYRRPLITRRADTRQSDTATAGRDPTRRGARQLRLRRMRRDDRRVPTGRSPHAASGHHRHGLARRTSGGRARHSGRCHSTMYRGNTRQSDSATAGHGLARPDRLPRGHRHGRRHPDIRRPSATAGGGHSRPESGGPARPYPDGQRTEPPSNPLAFVMSSHARDRTQPTASNSPVRPGISIGLLITAPLGTTPPAKARLLARSRLVAKAVRYHFSCLAKQFDRGRTS